MEIGLKANKDIVFTTDFPLPTEWEERLQISSSTWHEWRVGGREEYGTERGISEQAGFSHENKKNGTESTNIGLLYLHPLLWSPVEHLINLCVERYLLRWLKTVSSTFQDSQFDGSLQPLYTGWCQSHGINKLPNHRGTSCCYFCSTIGYHSNNMTC